MTQVIHETKEQHMLNKAKSIVRARRVRRTSNRNIWIVGSGNPRTPTKYYRVMFDDELAKSLLCECPAFTYCPAEDKDGKPYCCHLVAVSLFEAGGI